MQTAIKITILCIVLTIMGIITTSEFKDIQQDDDIVYSETDPRYHDQTCECDICTEEKEYYIEVAGNDTIIKAGDVLTVYNVEMLITPEGDTITNIHLDKK